MSTSFSLTARNAALTAHVNTMGGSVRAKFYSGTKPANLGTPAGTLLATLTYGSTAVTDANGATAGGVANGALTFGGFTQNAATHVSGNPTFIRFERADGSAYADIDIGSGAGNIPFTGAIVANQALTTTGLVWTDGNP
jgi:hypothetical protein